MPPYRAAPGSRSGPEMVQRTYRGHMARKRNGGRLAEIRAKRKAEEEARRKAEEEARKQRERDEIERIKEMARAGGSVPLSTQTAARYNSKSRPGKEAAAAAAGATGGTGSVVVVGGDFEGRFAKLEAQVGKEIPELKERIRSLEEQLGAMGK